MTASKHSAYSDFFWGLQGAGHNFGIVTQVEYKVYDVAENGWGDWTYAILIFKQDKLEVVFSLINTITNNGTGDVAYIDSVWFQRILEIDADFPVLRPSASPRALRHLQPQHRAQPVHLNSRP